MSSSTLLNLALLCIALVVSFAYLRREHKKEKIKENWKEDFKKYANTAEFKQRNSYAKQYIEIFDEDERWPNFGADGFELEDLARRAIYHPPEFPVPSLSEKRKIQSNDNVILCILRNQNHDGNEVWVRVTDCLPPDQFIGEIVGTAAEEDAELIDQNICFSANHIGLIERPATRPRPN